MALYKEINLLIYLLTYLLTLLDALVVLLHLRRRNLDFLDR